MKTSFNQNDIGLSSTDNEFINECKNCIFLYSITSNSYRCRLIDFGEEIFEELPNCFNFTFISEPLSDIFKL